LKFPWGEGKDEQRPIFKSLGNDSGFLLDIEGRKVVALKLPGNVAKEVAGQKPMAGGVFEELAKLWRRVEPEHWLIVASMQNGVMIDSERFAALVAEGLTQASGVTVPASDLIIAGGNKVAKTEEQAEIPLAT